MMSTIATDQQARRRAEYGIRSAAETADRQNPDWCAKALEKLRLFAREQKAPFTIEQARAAIAGLLPDPTDERAWGSVTRAAIAMCVIRKTGGYAPAKSSHGSPKAEYARGSAA